MQEFAQKQIKTDSFHPIAHARSQKMPRQTHDASPLAMERAMGNQAVQRMLRSGAIQAKLTINEPGDKYEQEADRIAEQVMSMPEPAVMGQNDRVQRKCPECEDEVQRQLEEVEDEEEPIQAKLDEQVQRQDIPEDEEEEILQKKGRSGGVRYASRGLEAEIRSMRGSGQPLSQSERIFFEPRFGHDFSRIKIHTDTQAAEAARALKAQAFTAGRNIIFGEGKYIPGTTTGRHLLAHELAHTIQQFGNFTLNTAPMIMPQNASRPIVRGPAKSHLAIRSFSQNKAPPTMLSCKRESQPYNLPHPCCPDEIKDLQNAVLEAETKAKNAVEGLKLLISTWGRVPSSEKELSASMALAVGFNIAFDKSTWVTLLGMNASEVAAIDKRDQDAANIILKNFQAIGKDIPNYRNPPPCSSVVSSGTPCFGCMDQRSRFCQEKNWAFVISKFKRIPSSPIFFCPSFFKLGDEEKAATFMHELAHNQKFGAEDYFKFSKHYGCPPSPEENKAPRLMDPYEFIGIAESYGCFVGIQEKYSNIYKQTEKLDQEVNREMKNFVSRPESPLSRQPESKEREIGEKVQTKPSAKYLSSNRPNSKLPLSKITMSGSKSLLQRTPGEGAHHHSQKRRIVKFQKGVKPWIISIINFSSVPFQATIKKIVLSAFSQIKIIKFDWKGLIKNPDTSIEINTAELGRDYGELGLIYLRTIMERRICRKKGEPSTCIKVMPSEPDVMARCIANTIIHEIGHELLGMDHVANENSFMWSLELSPILKKKHKSFDELIKLNRKYCAQKNFTDTQILKMLQNIKKYREDMKKEPNYIKFYP